jgi:hypothetical protein
MLHNDDGLMFLEHLAGIRAGIEHRDLRPKSRSVAA